MTRFFVPQQWADKALAADSIQIQGLMLTIPADGKKYQLTEAIRVMEVEGGDPDAAGVLGKVLTREEVDSRGGELVGESLILADTAYKVRSGFLAEPLHSGDPVSTLFRSNF